MALRQVAEPVDQRAAAFLIGLHRDAETLPASERRRGRQRFDNIKRQIEPVGLFSINRQANITRRCCLRERQQSRHQFGHHPRALGELVTRMQRAQLDRNARPLDRAALARHRADGLDGVAVGVQIAVGIGLGQGRFAEHVV